MIDANAMRRAALTLLLPALGLAACTLSPAPVDRYFRLNESALENGFAAPRLRGTLSVQRPRAEALTDGSHLVYRHRDNPEVFREPYQHWTDAPSLMLRDVIQGALQHAKLADRVLVPGLRTDVDYTMASRLVRFERVIEGVGQRVAVEIEFSLVRERDRSLLFHQSYSEGDPLAGSSAASAVEAYDRALRRILKRLLEDLDRTLPSELASLSAWPR